MFYKKVKDEQGAYADAAGVRYDICAARRIRVSTGSSDAYEFFPSLQAALEAWGLISLGEFSAISHEAKAATSIYQNVLSGDEASLR